MKYIPKKFVEFLQECGPEYHPNFCLDDWIEPAPDHKRTDLNEREEEHWKQTGKLKNFGRGKPKQEPSRCRMCGTIVIGEGNCREHVFQVHFEARYAQKDKENGYYWCPVFGCGKLLGEHYR